MTGRLHSWWLVLLACTLVAATARATPSRAVVRELEGDDTPSVRSALARMLAAQSFDLVSHAYFEKLAARVGTKDRGGRKRLQRALGLTVVLEGEVEQSEAAVSVTVRVLGTDGEVLESQEITAASRRELVKKIDREGWKLLGATIDEAEPPKEAKPRLLLLGLAGEKAEAVRAAVEKALGKAQDFELIPDAESQAARPAEAKQPQERALVAAALGATLLVSGKVAGARKLELTLTLTNGKDGGELGEVKLEAATVALLGRAVDKELVKRLGPLLARAERPSPPLEEAPQDFPDETPTPVAAAGRPSPLEAVIALGAGTRNYRYSDDLFAVLRAYEMGPTPAASVAARWYPGAHFSGGLAAHLGLALAYEQAFLIESRANGESYDTRAREWLLGLHARLPAGAFELGADVGLGAHAFEVEDDPSQPLVPSVDYRFLRAGLDGRFRSGPWLVAAAAGYRHVTDAGEVASAAWFPRQEVAGLDLGAHAGWALVPRLYLVLGVGYRRYWFSMNPEPGDALIAGGALDSYLKGWAGAAWELAGD